VKRLIFSVFLLGLATAAYAQGTGVAFGTIRQDTGLPVEMSADNLSVDQETGKAIFTGNVVIGQGEMRMSAPRVLVVYRSDSDGIQRLEATGGVTLVSGPDAAEAERAEYNIDTGTIEMSGNVLLSQGRSALSADRMSVRLSDGTARMSGRVRTILQSGSNN
jgi:lipopolysaccharide export system protein LptA